MTSLSYDAMGRVYINGWYSAPELTEIANGIEASQSTEGGEPYTVCTIDQGDTKDVWFCGQCGMINATTEDLCTYCGRHQ